MIIPKEKLAKIMNYVVGWIVLLQNSNIEVLISSISEYDFIWK